MAGYMMGISWLDLGRLEAPGLDLPVGSRIDVRLPIITSKQNPPGMRRERVYRWHSQRSVDTADQMSRVLLVLWVLMYRDLIAQVEQDETSSNACLTLRGS